MKLQVLWHIVCQTKLEKKKKTKKQKQKQKQKQNKTKQNKTKQTNKQTNKKPSSDRCEIMLGIFVEFIMGIKIFQSEKRVRIRITWT